MTRLDFAKQLVLLSLKSLAGKRVSNFHNFRTFDISTYSVIPGKRGRRRRWSYIICQNYYLEISGQEGALAGRLVQPC